MVKQLLHERALKLRREGYSYNYIVNKLHVSKGTLSVWLQNIPFKANNYTVKTIGNARIASGAYKHKVRMTSLEEAKKQAGKDINNFSNKDLMMLGLGIYIGEGGKSNDITRVINSDPKVIKLMIRWFEISFGINTKQIKIRLHLYPDNEEKKCIDYWSKETGIPSTQFFKSMIDYRRDKKTNKKGKLPFGTAHMGIVSLGNKKHGVYLHRLIMALIDRVL